MRLLVTGFGPFAGIDPNPSDRLARAIGALSPSGLELRARTPLPVEFGRAAELAIEEARAWRADAVLALGLARRARRVRVEAVGRRDATSSEPDGAGRVAPTGLDGPRSLETVVDVAAVLDALAARGVDAERSEDAGGYVCNDLYYRLLRAELGPVLFVHVPDLPADLGALPRALVESFAAAMPRDRC